MNLNISQFKRSLNTDTRTRKHLRSILFSFAFKGGSMLCSYIIIPVSLKYLKSPADYGVWLTISSFVAWINLFDGGLGNGLKNKLSEALTFDDKRKAKTIVSSAYAGLFLLSAFLSVLFIGIHSYINWAKILNVSSSLKNSIDVIVLYVFIGFFIRLAVDLINSILTAYQKIESVSLLNFIINASLLAGVFLLNLFNIKDRFFAICILYSFTPVLILIVVSIILFSKSLREVLPSFKLFNFSELKPLLTLGGKFFVIQISVIVVFSTDNLIIAELFSPADVSVYSICYKYFGILTFIWAIILSPYWVAFNEAYLKKDYTWIHNTIKRLEKGFLLLALLTVIALVVSPFVFKVSVQKQGVFIPFNLSVYMALFVLLSSCISIYVNFLNGTGLIKLQLYISVFSAIINIPLCILFAKTLHLGINGIILSSIISIFPSLVLGKIQYNKIAKTFDANPGTSGFNKGIWFK